MYLVHDVYLVLEGLESSWIDEQLSTSIRRPMSYDGGAQIHTSFIEGRECRPCRLSKVSKEGIFLRER